jgi:hypothetical protein
MKRTPDAVKGLIAIFAVLFLFSGFAYGADANNSTNSTVSATPKLLNTQIADAISAVIEAQFPVETIMAWDDEGLGEVTQDAWTQLSSKGMIKPSANYDTVFAEMKGWHQSYHMLHRSAKIGMVNQGLAVPKTLAWDELVREYYLGNGKNPIEIKGWDDAFTASVANGIPRTQHAMTVLGEQQAAMELD